MASWRPVPLVDEYFNLPDASTSGFHCSCVCKTSAVCWVVINTTTTNFSKHKNLSFSAVTVRMIHRNGKICYFLAFTENVSPVAITFCKHIQVSKTPFVEMSSQAVYSCEFKRTDGIYRPGLALKPWHTRCCTPTPLCVTHISLTIKRQLTTAKSSCRQTDIRQKLSENTN